MAVPRVSREPEPEMGVAGMTTVRPKKPQCETCRFFAEPRANGGDIGACRREPPVVVLAGTGRVPQTWWPEVLARSWCGRWEAKS